MKTVSVFVNEKNLFGNPVGIIVDEEQKISQPERQQIAKESGYSEVVFIENIESKNISIYNPVSEVSFAGHALVGTAYYFTHYLKTPLEYLQTKSGSVKTWNADGHTWVQAASTVLPPWNDFEVSSVQEVEDYSKLAAQNLKHTIVWSWIRKDLGEIRARTFASDWGIPEDEANGSGSMLLSNKVSKKILVIHGKGSEILAYEKDGLCNLGGRVQIAEK